MRLILQKSESGKPASTEDEKIGDLNQAAKKDVRKDGKAPKEAVSTQPDTKNRPRMRGILSKLVLSVVFMFAAVAVLLALNSQWKFHLKKEHHQLPVQKKEILQVEPPINVSKPLKDDPNAGFRAKLKDVTKVRETLLLKKQEVQELKQYYEEGVEQLENVILHEILSKKIYDYQQALKNKRIDLGLRTIQRRLAYIKKLDDPLQWLEQGSEELLYLKRKATLDLQLINIAGGIDMEMHMRHINAAIRKYHLTASNLAINLEGAKLQPLETFGKDHI